MIVKIVAITTVTKSRSKISRRIGVKNELGLKTSELSFYKIVQQTNEDKDQQDTNYILMKFTTYFHVPKNIAHTGM